MDTGTAVNPGDIRAELAVVATVYKIPDTDRAHIETLIAGTYRMLGQLAVERRLSAEEDYELPLSWVIDRWLAFRGYCDLRDPNDRYDVIWNLCKDRFPFYGIGVAPAARPDPEPTPEKDGCAIL
jgi:hypothetical protein